MANGTDWKVQLMLQVLLFFGGAATGIGSYVGQEWVFTGYAPDPPKITRATVEFPSWQGPRSPLSLLWVELDSLGRIEVDWKGKDGVIHQLTRLKTVADKFWVPLSADGCPLYAGDAKVPSWVDWVEVRPYDLEGVAGEPIRLKSED